MASNSRRTAASIEEDLFKNGFDFDFHQAVKILESLNPTALSLGATSSLYKEALFIKAHVSNSFLPSDIYKVLEEAPLPRHGIISPQATKPQLIINFFSLAGVQGALPTPYNELLIDRIRHKDFAFRDFLDIFNHRFASLFHRIRKKYWIGVDVRSAEQTVIGKSLLSFTGIAAKNLQKRLSFPDHGLLFYAGLIWQKPKSAVALKNIISHYFKTEAKIHPFKGRWLPLEDSQVTRIGKSGQFQLLGQGAALGTRVWDKNTHFIIELGPLSFKKYFTFLPIGSAYKSLCDLCYFFLRKEYSFNIELNLMPEEVPNTKLGESSYLGWTTFLKTTKTTTKPKSVHKVILEPKFLLSS